MWEIAAGASAARDFEVSKKKGPILGGIAAGGSVARESLTFRERGHILGGELLPEAAPQEIPRS